MTKVQKNKNNISLCSCNKGCPSYNDCAKKANEGLFCAIGKSSCSFKMNGCICGSCPVHKANGLKSGYYCMNGTADVVDLKAKK
ncbi:MAG: DUF2769 domain-containing protein [Parachlamydiales bacterium]|jgi:hypothetical protein